MTVYILWYLYVYVKLAFRHKGKGKEIAAPARQKKETPQTKKTASEKVTSENESI